MNQIVVDKIRALQLREGNGPCFRTRRCCLNEDCCWKEICCDQKYVPKAAHIIEVKE